MNKPIVAIITPDLSKIRKVTNTDPYTTAPNPIYRMFVDNLKHILEGDADIFEISPDPQSLRSAITAAKCILFLKNKDLPETLFLENKDLPETLKSLKDTLERKVRDKSTSIMKLEIGANLIDLEHVIPFGAPKIVDLGSIKNKVDWDEDMDKEVVRIYLAIKEKL